MKIAFLFGAGASVPARMPSTAKITKRVLSGEGLREHTDSNYYIEAPSNGHPGDGTVRKICEFLLILKDVVDKFYLCGSYQSERSKGFTRNFGRHETNYEDLYYLTKQIRDCDTHEYENPAIRPLMDILFSSEEVKAIYQAEEARGSRINNFSNLCREACNYIECVVWEMLETDPQASYSLSMLAEASRDPKVSAMDIYTLNHDKVLEGFLTDESIPFDDGFTNVRGEVRFWNPGAFQNPGETVRLFKLHGSIDWFRYPIQTTAWASERVGIPLHIDKDHVRDERGELYKLPDARPMILIGTFNKLMDYTSGIFADLHFAFYSNIRETDHMVICGYGFGDKGINTRLLDWIHSSDARRVVVIDPELESLRETARGAVRWDWRRLFREKKLKLIKCGIEDVTWGMVKDLLLSA